jgi:hypothetical protein
MTAQLQPHPAYRQYQSPANWQLLWALHRLANAQTKAGQSQLPDQQYAAILPVALNSVTVRRC